jgi:organic radical activating enzyme
MTSIQGTVDENASSLPHVGGAPSEKLSALLADDPELTRRVTRLRTWSRGVRASLYHVTHACNLRCKGCWYFQFGFDTSTGKDVVDVEAWRSFARAERERGVTSAVLIGGEPSLYPRRINAFMEAMPYVWISSNGLVPMPRDGFENLGIGVTLFGGGPLDDELRGISPTGRRLSGLFDTALKNYRNDRRVFYFYALSLSSVPYLEDVVKRAGDNGNRVLFNYYSDYTNAETMPGSGMRDEEQRLLEKALEVRAAYPDVVLSHPYYIRAIITGRSHWGSFGYDVCPSVSKDYEANRARLLNGNPTLPGFNSIAPDLRTVNLCSNSGRCAQCRDSQAFTSWLLVSMHHFLGSKEQLLCWIELSESFWRQFCWSPYFSEKAGTVTDVFPPSPPVMTNPSIEPVGAG